jgi:hypothetical protein
MSVLQRELDAYNDALSYYNRGLQNYNKKADTFNASFLTDSKGNRYVYEKPNIGVGYTLGPDGMLYPFPVETGNTYYVVDASGKLTKTSKPAGSYGLTTLEGNYQTLRINPDEQGNYPTKPEEWTKKFTAKKPDPTVAATRKLNEPAIVDVERTGGSGLISSAFNF